MATVVSHQFITLSVHLCVQHEGREAVRHAGLSASSETYYSSHVPLHPSTDILETFPHYVPLAAMKALVCRFL